VETRLGVITELIISKDGFIRGAKVLIGKTGSEIKRPVNKLFPIEYDTKDNSNDKQQEDNNIEAEEPALSEIDIPNDVTKRKY